jgi:hypothetical protein
MASLPDSMAALVKKPHFLFGIAAWGGYAVFVVSIDAAKEWAVVQLLPWTGAHAIVWDGVPRMLKVKVKKIKSVLGAADGKPLEIVHQPGVVVAMVCALLSSLRPPCCSRALRCSWHHPLTLMRRAHSRLADGARGGDDGSVLHRRPHHRSHH